MMLHSSTKGILTQTWAIPRKDTQSWDDFPVLPNQNEVKHYPVKFIDDQFGVCELIKASGVISGTSDAN